MTGEIPIRASETEKHYIFGSRILTHILFWLGYYLLFGFIWADNGDYRTSYFLEFILLPVRMMAVYVTLYILVPRFLQKGKNLHFIAYYLVILAVSGILLRILTYLFYEWAVVDNSIPLISFHYWMRAVILVNSTVLFVVAIKIVLMWQKDLRLLAYLQKRKEEQGDSPTIEIRSDSRNYKVPVNDILYIEGLGNYVRVHLKDQKIISYQSLKDMTGRLPAHFIRIHKSFIINKNKISSYNAEDVDINGNVIPIGRSYKEMVEQLSN